MIKIEHLTADGFEAAIRGMRNPLNSWSKSDSMWANETDGQSSKPYYSIGKNDLGLAQRLIDAGPEHAKFLRQINVSFDITTSLYLFKEFDTYKINTTSNSCSTMHKITEKEFTLGDFSCEHLTKQSLDCLLETIDMLNSYRNIYVNWEEQDEFIQQSFNYDKKLVWWQLIQLLPSSYNQKRTVTMNYAVLRNIIHQRKNHKLDEWHGFIESLKGLPYANELLFYHNLEVRE